jgi:predicted GIY-YIG superfamily endonuclease
MFQGKFYVYILTNQNKTVLYTGVTNNLEQRIIEHWSSRNCNTSLHQDTRPTFYCSMKVTNMSTMQSGEKRMEKGKENGAD